MPVIGLLTIDAKRPAIPITTNSSHIAGVIALNELTLTVPNIAPIYAPKIQRG